MLEEVSRRGNDKYDYVAKVPQPLAWIYIQSDCHGEACTHVHCRVSAVGFIRYNILNNPPGLIS